MVEQSKTRRLVYGVVALSVLALVGHLVRSQTPGGTPDLVRWSHNVPGEAKPVQLYADAITTWTEHGRRAVVLRGKVWIEQGVVQIRMNEGVVWVDEAARRISGIYRLDVYAEGNVSVEDGPKALRGARGLIDLSTRGEIRLRAYTNRVAQQALTQDALYVRARSVKFPGQAPVAPDAIQPVIYREPRPVTPPPATGTPAAGSPAGPAPRAPVSWPPPPDPGAAPGPVQRMSYLGPPDDPGGTVVRFAMAEESQATPPAPGGVAALPVQQVVPPGSPPPTDPPGAAPPIVPTTPPTVPPPGTPPGAPPAAVPTIPVPAPPPPVPAPPVPARRISIVPRSSAPIQSQSYPQPNGETAVVVTSGVILTVRNADARLGLIDIEADRVVFWTRGNTQQVVGQLNTPDGHETRTMEFYLSGNVELRQQNATDNRLLRADEVYYDVGRNVAIALRADFQFTKPGVPEPIHLQANELFQLSPNLFKVVQAQTYASRLPSDPGLKVVVAEATLEEKVVPRRSIFGRPIIDRKTGQPLTENQQLFDGRDVVFQVESIPVFYMPRLKGDINDPLGPLKNLSFSYNRIFGFEAMMTLNVYELLGMDKVPGTRWDLNVDYLSARGPALGTEFDYTGTNLFEIPNKYTGLVKAYGIYDTGTDILGGGVRGETDDHPNWRGRFLWQQNVQDLPAGFTVQTQLAAISDRNFLEQYFKREWDMDPNQETTLYVKQQVNNWAWTGLLEPRLRTWITETEWLPRLDGYLLGESFFDRLTYNAHANAGFANLQVAEQGAPPYEPTDKNDSTGRFDLMQELSMPLQLGPVKFVPYGVLDTTYYTEDLTGGDAGRIYGGGGVRASIPFTRLYPDIKSDLFNLDAINHKIVLTGNYFNAATNVPFTRLPQLDRLNDDATDQALRDLNFYLPPNLTPLQKALFDPQTYAIRRLVDNRVDTLDNIEVFQADLRQRWQTKRGYPGQEHIIDWMTLDVNAEFFPHSNRDNFGETVGPVEYDWTWNIGDRTSLFSGGWFDSVPGGGKVFNFGVLLNRPDRTSFVIAYRQIDPVGSQAVTLAVTYIFSPKYAVTATTVYDFGTNTAVANSLLLTRMGSDLQVSLGVTYNAILSTFGVTFEIVPNLMPMSKKVPALNGLGAGMLGR